MHDEQQADRQKREEKERRWREKKKRESQPLRFSKTLELPQNCDTSESQEENVAESSSQVGHKIETQKPVIVHKNKSELATLENAATLFPSFIMPSLQKQMYLKNPNTPEWKKICFPLIHLVMF